MLRVRQQFFRLRTAQAVDDLLARHRRVVHQRHQQRPHLDAVGVPQIAEGRGVLLGKARQRLAGLVEVLVHGDAGAVAEHRGLLHERLDVGETVARQIEVLEQRAMPDAHVEIGVQIELVARCDALLGAAAAADAIVRLDHGDLHAGAREISGGRQTVVTGTDHHSVIDCHVCPRARGLSAAVAKL